MKISNKLTALLSLQLMLFLLLLGKNAVADPVISMAFNQANALNSQLFQSQWGQRVAGSGEEIGPVNDESSTGKNPESPIVAAAPQNDWEVKIEGNGIFGQMPGTDSYPNDLNHYFTAGGGITSEFSFHWNSSVITGLYVGYQGSQLTKKDIFSSISTDTFTQTDNAPRFGLFGSYGQPDGKGFYGFGLIGGTYHQYTFSDQYKGEFTTWPPSAFPITGTQTQTGNIGAPELDSMVAGSYDFKLKGFTFGPTTSLQYTYYYQNDATYQTVYDIPALGVYFGGISGKQENFNTSSLLYSLGGHVAYTWNATKDLVVVPQINMSWQHQFLQTIYNQNDFSY